MSKHECEFQHKIEQMDGKIDKACEDVAYIRGKIDGIDKQKTTDVTFFGMLIALVMGLWNLIK